MKGKVNWEQNIAELQYKHVVEEPDIGMKEEPRLSGACCSCSELPVAKSLEKPVVFDGGITRGHVT